MDGQNTPWHGLKDLSFSPLIILVQFTGMQYQQDFQHHFLFTIFSFVQMQILTPRQIKSIWNQWFYQAANIVNAELYPLTLISIRSMERKMQKFKLRNKVPYKIIRAQTKLTDVIKYIAKQKWKLAGHVVRVNDKYMVDHP